MWLHEWLVPNLRLSYWWLPFVFRPVLFIIYINDIDIGLNNLISKFADDTEIGNWIITHHDRISLQEVLKKIWDWSQRWEVPFNINKCHKLQAGTRNKKKKKLNTKSIIPNSKAYNAWKTLAFHLRLASNSPSNAKMSQIKLLEYCVSYTEISRLKLKT